MKRVIDLYSQYLPRDLIEFAFLNYLNCNMAKSVAPKYLQYEVLITKVLLSFPKSNNVCKVGPPIRYCTKKMQHFSKDPTLNFKHTILCNLKQAL